MENHASSKERQKKQKRKKTKKPDGKVENAPQSYRNWTDSNAFPTFPQARLRLQHFNQDRTFHLLQKPDNLTCYRQGKGSAVPGASYKQQRNLRCRWKTGDDHQSGTMAGQSSWDQAISKNSNSNRVLSRFVSGYCLVINRLQ